jgi:tetratricopeptide (TPR) repeat protein
LWNFKKNSNAGERREILESLDPQGSVLLRNRVVDKAKVKRWMKMELRTKNHIPAALVDQNEAFATTGPDQIGISTNFDTILTSITLPDEHEDQDSSEITVQPKYAELIGFLTVAAVLPKQITRLDGFESDENVSTTDQIQLHHTLDDFCNTGQLSLFSVKDTTLPSYDTRIASHTEVQGRSSYFEAYNIARFFNAPSPFPSPAQAVSKSAAGSYVIPFEVALQMVPEYIQRFQKLQDMDSRETIELVHGMRQIADAYYNYNTKEHNRQAEFWYRRIVTAKQRVLYHDPLGTLQACTGVIISICLQGRYLDAHSIARDFCVKLQKLLPPHHDLVIVLRRTWARLLRNINGEGHGEQEATRYETFQICLSAFGPRNKHTLWALQDLEVSLHQKLFGEREEIIRIALDIARQVEKDESCKFMVTRDLMVTLGRVLCDQKKYPEALDILENAKSLYGPPLEEGDEGLVTIFCYEAVIKYEMGQLRESEQLLLNTLREGSEKRNISLQLELHLISLMAWVLEDSGRLEEATRWSKKAFAINIEIYGLCNEQTMRSCIKLGLLYAKQKFYDKAVDSFQQTIENLAAGKGRGPKSAKDCIGWLRVSLAHIEAMRKSAELL